MIGDIKASHRLQCSGSLDFGFIMKVSLAIGVLAIVAHVQACRPMDIQESRGFDVPGEKGLG